MGGASLDSARDESPSPTIGAVKHHCPICKKPTDSEKDSHFPFCSERCKLLDLGNWAAERYVVSEPVIEDPAPEQSDPNETEH